MSDVAVIMSVYHGDTYDYLHQSVTSILHQTYPCKIYLFQDGPVSYEIERYLESLTTNGLIKLYKREKSQGLASALNILIDRCLENSSIKYIARMDADDVSRFDRIYRQVDYMRKNPQTDVLGGACQEFGLSDEIRLRSLPLDHEGLVDYAMIRCPFVHPTVMFRREVFSDGTRYPVDTWLTEDMALWYMLIMKNRQFANIPDVLIDYRLSEFTVMRRKGMKKALSEVALRLRYMNLMHRLTPVNVLLIMIRLMICMMPGRIMVWVYKNR